MKVLLKKATVLSPSSPFHGNTRDILIDNGIISKIATNLSDEADHVIENDNLFVSPGWMDCFANFCDPGQEFRETLATGSKAAAAGGFTDVILIPNTQPVISGKGQVEYVIQKGKSYPVTIHPLGSVTKNAEGKELAEMYDMYQTGAIAFSDGLQPVQSSGILQKALEYVLAIDATIIQLPDDKSIGTHGLMNEGEVSTRLGLPGKPALAEELMIARDIELARYTGSKIHFTG
ncbi:MAG: dihydroorotase, partial [Ginsengibacter sp.]